MNTRPPFKLNYLALISATTLISPYALASDPQSLEQRVAALEAKTEDKSDAWYDALTFSGVIEVEANYTDPDSGASESDLVIATAELGTEAELTERLSTTLVLLYEEDEGGVDVDIATINYDFGKGFSFVLGQEYVPFGAYGTALVSDPISLEFGETRETALITHYKQGGFNGAFYIFNGDNDEEGKQKINDYGARVSFSTDLFTIGGDYISNLGDSDGLTDTFTYGEDGAADDSISGAAVFAEFGFGAVTVFTEFLTALDKYENTDDNIEAEPSAAQFELAFKAGDFTYAASYQQTDDAEFIGLPEERVSVGFSTEIFGGLGLGVELTRDEDYAGDTTNNFVLQLAAEF